MTLSSSPPTALRETDKRPSPWPTVRLSSLVKVPLVALLLPILTWRSIQSYWQEFYADSEVPLYYLGSIELHRSIWHLPLQVILMATIAGICHRYVMRVSWPVLLVVCGAAGPIATATEELGRSLADQTPALACMLWDYGPHVTGVTLVLLVLVLGSKSDQYGV